MSDLLSSPAARMGAQNQAAVDGGDSSASEDLAKAIRRIVSEELDKARNGDVSAPGAVSQTWREALGLIVVFLNIVLIYTWLPEKVRTGDNVNFITKLITLIGGGFALTNPALFRKWLAELGRRKRFLIGNSFVLLFVAMARFAPLPMRAEIDPPGALISEAGGQASSADETMFLTLGDHSIEIAPPKGGIRIDHEEVKTRKIALPWNRQLWYSLPWTPRPRWSLVAPVDLWFNRPAQYTVTIVSTKCPFDYEFHGSHSELKFKSDRMAERVFPERKEHDQIHLPFGEYNLKATARDDRGVQTCPAQNFLVDRDHPDGAVKFECK